MSTFIISIFSISFSFAKKKYSNAKFTSSKLSTLSSKKAFLKPEYAGFVMDADTGQVLESSEGDSLRHPASLTKMMTLYMMFKGLKENQLTLNTLMPVSAHASSQAPSKLGLRPGEKISVRDAILALVTKSANDVASVVAEYLGGTESTFGQKMTAQAKNIGMHNTTFVNASGLPNPRQISTARDMAILSRSLYKQFPQFFNHFKLKSFNYKGTNHHNHNHLLGKVEGVDGFKTGYTVASGSNLAATAIRYNASNTPKRLIVVVLGGKTRHWRDAKVTELLERHYHQMGYRNNYDRMSSAQLTLTNLVQSVQNQKTKTSSQLISLKPSQALKKAPMTVRQTRYQGTVTKKIPKNMAEPSINRHGLDQLIQKVNYEAAPQIAPKKGPQPAGWIIPSPPSLFK